MLNADTTSLALTRGMPSNEGAERMLLGSILDRGTFMEVAAGLSLDDFALESHRRIFSAMGTLADNGDKIDHVTLANELIRIGELESVGGLSCLVSLNDGLPRISNLSAYVKIVRDKSSLRRIAIIGQQLMNRALMAEDQPSAILSATTELLMGIGIEKASAGPRTPMEFIESFPGGINTFLDPSRREKGISSGFTRFDEMTGGMRAGELLILAARPSQGKTALAINIAWHIATRLSKLAVIFSLEMSMESLMTRMICAAARVDSQRFRAGYLNEGERQKLRRAVSTALEAPFLVDDDGGLTLMDLRSKLTRVKQQHGSIGIVVIDYLQLMGSKGKSENRNQEVSTISRGLKLLSKEMDCPFLVLSQLSRATETRAGDHRPQLSDLRDSGSLEQDADLVAFIFREEVYKRDREDLRGIAELILAKQRQGPIGKIDMIFIHALTKFENRAEDLGDDAGEDGRLPYAD